MAKKIIKRAIHAKDFLNEPIEYGKSFSRGIKVVSGSAVLLYVSGTASVDENGKTFCPGDFSCQTKRTFDNITALLKSEGADWHDVVKTVCYLKDMKHYSSFNKHRNSFYKKLRLDPFPASVCVQAKLCRKELLVEIETTAILGK